MMSVIASVIIWLPVEAMALLFTAMVLIAGWEWAALAGLSSVTSRVLFSGAVLLLIVLTAWHCQIFSESVQWHRVRDVLGLGCLWWAIALLWVKSYPGSAVIWHSIPMRLLMGLLTLLPAWLALVYLRLHEFGVPIIFILIALVASADIGAYFTGRAWGNAKLAPNVSPGKSWAGFWGGLALSTSLAALLWFLFGRDHWSLVAVVVVAIFTALASVLGDLLESMVKRERGVKDSGTILPGHGGMMDRLDSMSAAAPVFALSLILIG